MLSKVDEFLERNEDEIPAADRAKIREQSVKDIKSNGAIRTNFCPRHLKDELRRAIAEDSYRYHCRDDRGNPIMFNPKITILI
jgi:hypothetical protein